MLDFIALKLMVPLLTRCKLCLLKFIQLTENKRQTEYKQSARIMMHRMSNPIVKMLNLTFVFASIISMESASKFGVVPYHLNLHIFLKAKIGGHLKQLFFYLLYLSINALGFNYFVAVVLKYSTQWFNQFILVLPFHDTIITVWKDISTE